MPEAGKDSGLDPRSKRILVVDDDEDVRDFLRLVLSREGFQVACAAQGDEALRLVAERAPDLVVMDLMLPLFGGFEVLRRMQSGAAAGVPVLVITGRYTDSATEELIRKESNVVEFFTKPVKPGPLTAAAHRALKTRPAPTGQGV